MDPKNPTTFKSTWAARLLSRWNVHLCNKAVQPPALRKIELKWDLMMHKSLQYLYLGQISPCSLQCHLFRLSKKKKKKKLFCIWKETFTDTFNLFYICGHLVLFQFSSQCSLYNAIVTVIAKMISKDHGRVRKGRSQQHCERHVSLLMYKLA